MAVNRRPAAENATAWVRSALFRTPAFTTRAVPLPHRQSAGLIVKVVRHLVPRPRQTP